MKIVSRAVGVLVFISCSSAALFAQSRTFVSARTGNDANACSVTAPCRSFDRAALVVTTAGEVIALDSGGYGSISITKPLTIAVPAGVHAAITPNPTTQVGVDVNPGAGDSVNLRGIAITGTGGGSAIGILSTNLNGTFTKLNIENCIVTGVATGIQFATPGQLHIKDTVVRNADTQGIVASGFTFGISNFATVTIERVTVENAGGAVLESASGIAALGFSRMTIRNSTVSSCFRGITAGGTKPGTSFAGAANLGIEESTISGNYVGVLAAVDGTANSYADVILSNTTVSFSEFKSVEKLGGPAARVYTRGNNSFYGNGGGDPMTPTPAE